MSLAITGQSADALPASAAAVATGTVQLPAYRILLHHDGRAYVAEVPELSACKGMGASPVAALQAAQEAIAAWLQRAARSGAEPPALLAPADLARTVRDRLAANMPEQKHVLRMSPVKLLLVKKFGKMSNRELAGRIGLVGRDAPTMLSAAASGKGTRKARCAIAHALEQLPSRLWPDRPAAICQDDDDMFCHARKTALAPSELLPYASLP